MAPPFPVPFERVFHVTVASNFAPAFDKYTRRYDKAALPLSKFPRQFFVLSEHELALGIKKATRLLTKLGLPRNRLLVLEAHENPARLHPNERTGKGRYLQGSSLRVRAVHWAEQGQLLPCSVEEAYALSLCVRHSELKPYAHLTPRTLSVLPVAQACQARCWFCFSKGSASLEQKGKLEVLDTTTPWLLAAKLAGAKRFVITGGGEPGLLAHETLLYLIRQGQEHLGKVVLITNGVHLTRVSAEDRKVRLTQYRDQGLDVLALSRHHHIREVNAGIMGLDPDTERVLASLVELQSGAESPTTRKLRVRLICVLQRGGVETEAEIANYLRWAAGQGADEVCFKELYVSTQQESAYSARPQNAWSLENQVPLSRVLHAMAQLGFVKRHELPWGAPVFEGALGGRRLSVAAYTEPSLFWERTHGIARSWNLMADGSCLASLEDPQSGLRLVGSFAQSALPSLSAARTEGAVACGA